MTANLKGASPQLLIEEFYWFTVADAELKTPTPTRIAPTAAHPSIRLVNVILEATGNITVEWKTNASACPTVA